MGNNMCKRAASGTYLNVNALPVNAQPRFSPLIILSAIFSFREVVVFFIDSRSKVGDDVRN